MEALGDGAGASSLRREHIDSGSRDAVFYNDEARYLLDAGKASDALAILDKARANGAENEYTATTRAKVLAALKDCGAGD